MISPISARAYLVVCVALLVAVASTSAARAQIYNDPAPPGNVQALRLSGAANVGQRVDLTCTATPNASVGVLFAWRAGTRIDFPFGALLLDPAELFVAVSLPPDASGVGRMAFTLPQWMTTGQQLAMQCAIQDTGGIQLSNLSRIFVTGGVVQGPQVLTLDPLPASTMAAQVLVSGTATAPGSQVVVEGGQNAVTTTANLGANGDEFSTNVPLRANRLNHLFLTETPPGGPPIAPVTADIVQDSQPPELHVDFPANGAMPVTANVTVAGRVSDMLSGFMGLTVTANGQPATVNIGIGTNGTWEVRDLPLNAVNTPTQITVVTTDVNGNSTSRMISVTRVPFVGPRMFGVSGNNQSARVDTRLPQPLVVQVLQADGTPFANKLVTFAVTRSNGRLAPDMVTPGTMTLQARTDVTGVARALWTLGSDAGCGNNRVEVSSPGVTGVVGFCASADAAPPAQINVGSGNNQRAAVGAPLPMPLVAWVSDSCNGVADVPVTFEVVLGGGALIVPGNPPASAVTMPTGTTGHASVQFALGPNPGNNIVRASFAGSTEPATFQAMGLAQQSGQGTTWVGQVVDNADRPIQGATCHLLVGTTLLPPMSTDVNGKFGFTGASSGPGRLNIDGSTAFHIGGPTGTNVPTGSFPTLTYEVLVVADAENSLPGPVVLPSLDPANERTYDGINDVELTVAGIEGLKMIVTGGSMTLANGAPAPPGTILKLNQVHADNVPMPMPDGAAPPFAWTLQPSGARFDPPIRIEYPNMSSLPPGAIANFLSFNHDTQNFEIVASAHVTDDGSTIITDPGSGLQVAGWGCNCPPYSVATDCEVCVENCVDNGMLSGGTTTVTDASPTIASMTTFSVSGVMDSGGTKEIVCPDGSGQSVPIPPGTISYTYVVTKPDGSMSNGSGASVNVNCDQCGRYSCTFTATSARECPPPNHVVPAVTAFANTNCPDPGVIAPAITVLNDIAAGMIAGGGLTTISLNDVTLTACVYVDPATNSWRMRVQTAAQTIHWGIRTGFYTEPILPPAANATITCANAIAAADDMADYAATQGAGPNWHMAAASTTHEMHHVDWLRNLATTTWPAIEMAIEMHVLGQCPAMDLAAANAAMATYIQARRVEWYDPNAVPPEPPAYAAGQAVLDPMIAAIRAWHMNNCP